MPSSTSVAPTTPPATTTKAPTTPPKPTFGDYSVKDKQGMFCLLAQLSATFNVTYLKKKAGNKTEEMSSTVSMPFNKSLVDTSNSKCSEENGISTLEVVWPVKEKFYKFALTFAAAESKEDSNGVNYTDWNIKRIAFVVNTTNNKDFENATERIIKVASNGTEMSGFHAKYGKYYNCAGKRSYKIEDTVSVQLDHVKIEPFVKSPSKNETFSGDYEDCENENPSKKPDDDNIVPIAVGCALAGLVLIVLIAYIIGRRKSHRGYEKV
ncbi:predicted protein [Nematostella vectensis]|uniref:Lysosome-associated membrane glycoprotein 5 n=1 Tax=Nematostella vectensis TaxID=45351 RepID=A7RTH6_NEMVE|nr:predicted protein [Nematostella vectensis]|eukprot:XP_001637329.1 predicted protein [Nematostella vectensis]